MAATGTLRRWFLGVGTQHKLPILNDSTHIMVRANHGNQSNETSLSEDSYEEFDGCDDGRRHSSHVSSCRGSSSCQGETGREGPSPVSEVLLNEVRMRLSKKERENAALLVKLRRAERTLQSRKQHYGRNNVSRDTWDGSDLANLDNINRYCKEKLYPYYKFLPSEWNTYSPVEVGTICYKLMNLVAVPDNVTEEYYYSERIVPMVNKKYVEMRSNINGHIRKLYQSMSYILFDLRHCVSDQELTHSVLSTLVLFLPQRILKTTPMTKAVRTQRPTSICFRMDQACSSARMSTGPIAFPRRLR